jgi:hypothetical protein
MVSAFLIQQLSIFGILIFSTLLIVTLLYLDGAQSTTNGGPCELSRFHLKMNLSLSLLTILCLIVLCIVMILNIRTKLKAKNLKPKQNFNSESFESSEEYEPPEYAETPHNNDTCGEKYEDGSSIYPASSSNRKPPTKATPDVSQSRDSYYVTTVKSPVAVENVCYDVVKRPKQLSLEPTDGVAVYSTFINGPQ